MEGVRAAKANTKKTVLLRIGYFRQIIQMNHHFILKSNLYMLIRSHMAPYIVAEIQIIHDLFFNLYC